MPYLISFYSVRCIFQYHTSYGIEIYNVRYRTAVFNRWYAYRGWYARCS